MLITMFYANTDKNTSKLKTANDYYIKTKSKLHCCLY